MSVVKVIEIVAQSEKGFDDAVRTAVKEAAKTIKGIKSVWVDNLSAKVEGDKISQFRVNAKVSFLVETRK
ncbi:MAG TPA: dodecin family protein [Gemmatimonadales bacterium]|jgi:flavin-binding protein dodecin|nr:dodecin family protein [Gemmatimonadales bacterium]